MFVDEFAEVHSRIEMILELSGTILEFTHSNAKIVFEKAVDYWEEVLKNIKSGEEMIGKANEELIIELEEKILNKN